MAVMIIATGFIFTACGTQKDVGISSITINSETQVIEIYEGEFNEAGITATVIYENDTEEIITITEDMVTGYNDGPQWVNTPGTYAITVLFKGKTIDITVKVLPKYISVRFFDGYGNLIKKQSIRKGTDAVAPNDGYEIQGMKFIGWDRLFTNLTEDIDVYAMYGNVTALNIETQFQDWQYRTRRDSGNNDVTYEFFKFADGKVYYYNGKLESFLYSAKDSIQGVEYTAVYTSRVNDEICGSWEIRFRLNSDVYYSVYYDNEKLYTITGENYVYYTQLNAKYALQDGSWYKWVISEGENEEIANLNGYIRIIIDSNNSTKIEYYKGTTSPTSDSSVTILNYSMSVIDNGNIVIVTEETSSIHSLRIVCCENPYISNLDANLTIVE